jgi:threonine aldolase
MLPGIELRSDTFTQPTPAMREVMMQAAIGDDVFGEDPSVNALEAFAARLFGMEAALFCPSGTMTNQIAIKCHTSPGDEVICESLAHVYIYEGGGMALNASAQARPLTGEYGILQAAQVEEAINPDDIHKARTRLVCLENTSNRGGGTCYPMPVMQDIAAVCRRHGLALHLDGARIFNAILARKESAADYGQIFDSISVCLSKGLGAPVGSVLIGNQPFIRQARRIRKVFGGGMRQAGYLAAAGLYALQQHTDRLAEDHFHATMLADSLKHSPWVEMVNQPETNIVLFSPKPQLDASQIISALREKGIRAGATGKQEIRLVTHLGVSRNDIAYACEVLPALYP